MWNDKTVLIAEDTEFNYILIKALIERTGAKVIWAPNGQIAVDTCQANKNIDLILMDIRMPLLDGYEATRAIREFNKDIPIIAQTAFGLDEEESKIAKAGFNEIMYKPIKSEQLNIVLNKYFSKPTP
jgi:two-component system, cell cycle response regulator DivK